MLRGRFWAKTEFFQCFSEAKSHHAGEFDGRKFCTGIDSKGVKNNLQGFEGKFVLLGLGGGGCFLGGYKPGGLLTEQTGHIPDRLDR